MKSGGFINRFGPLLKGLLGPFQFFLQMKTRESVIQQLLELEIILKKEESRVHKGLNVSEIGPMSSIS